LLEILQENAIIFLRREIIVMHKPRLSSKNKKDVFLDEPTEWLNLTPAQRVYETTKLWQVYLSLGGRLDPEPDPQSPFYIFQEQS
jgi:hypothetical protein